MQPFVRITDKTETQEEGCPTPEKNQRKEVISRSLLGSSIRSGCLNLELLATCACWSGPCTCYPGAINSIDPVFVDPSSRIELRSDFIPTFAGMQLHNYIAGQWVAGTGKQAALTDASTGEHIAITFLRRADHRRHAEYGREVDDHPGRMSFHGEPFFITIL